MRYVRSLSEEEIEELRELISNTKDTRKYRRAMIILLSNEGYPVSKLTSLFTLSDKKVRYWIDRYEREGIDGLSDKPRSGRPPKVKEEIRESLLEVVRQSPRTLGKDFSTWTLAGLQEWLKEEGVEVSLEWVRQTLLQGGIRFKRPKHKVTSPDPDYESKKNELGN